MNNITIVGRLTADPELKNINGYSCLSFGLAERSISKNADGEYMTNFFDVTAWRNLADRVSKWFRKGDKVCVSGSLTIRHYVTKDGKDGCAVQIRAENIEGMSPRRDDNSGGQACNSSNQQRPAAPVNNAQNNGFTPVEDDELPF